MPTKLSFYHLRLFRFLSPVATIFLLLTSLLQASVPLAAQPTQFTLTYTAGANGSITGTVSQTVNQGADGSAVTAVANVGYHFTSWSDGVLTASRTDTNVQANISVTANFTATQFTLTYTAGANGSITGTVSQTVNQGADGSAVTAVANVGYHFTSWSDGVLTASRTDTNVQANISVTANFTATQFTLTYTAGANGSITGTVSQTVNQGADGSAVTAVANVGYHFTSWSDGVLTASRTDTNVQANISVTANFTATQFTLTYTAGANGSITGTVSQTVNQGADGSAVTAVANVGYHFTSWSDGVLTASRTDTNVQANISVTANFTATQFTLTYTAGANGSITGTVSQTVNQGADGSAVTAVANVGYHFTSWSDGVLTASRTDTNVQANISVTANFTATQFTLTYTAGANGSITGTVSQTVNQGADGSAVTAVANVGYHFTSWSDGVLTASRTDTNVQANISVTANFTATQFTLTYTAGANGSITGTVSQTVNQGADGSAVTAVANVGYHFTSWSDGVLTASRTDTNVQANISVTANFTATQFTLTYTAGANGSITGTVSQTVNQGADGSAVTAVANVGYHFTSWSDGVLTASRTDTNVQANISVTANFTATQFTLTYTAGANGSITGTVSQTVNQGADGSAVTAVANVGYHFTSWSDGVLTASRTDTNVQANISVTANFTATQFTLTYTAGANGSITGTVSQTVNQGADGSAVTAVANVGYHFTSWSDGVLTASRTDTNVQANISVTANFTATQFTLTYTAGANGSITGTVSQTVNQGADGSAVTAVANVGYHFTSWSDGVLTASRTDTNVQANISVTANFTATQFTLTYTAGANGSITGTVSQTVNQGADGSAVTAVANVGYHFTSWSDGVLTASRTDTNVQANISVTANFTATQFTLTYTAGANGSITGTVSQTVNQGADGSAVTAVANVGYHFTSWSDGVLTASRTDTNVQANISVTANFTATQFTLTYTAGANGSITGTVSQTVNQGADGSAVTAVANVGYHFTSWSDGVLTASRTDTNVQANISVTANFTATQFTLTYTAGANGSITGTVSQTVNQGADGSAVTAVANVGYHFTSWSDGVLTASRTDTNVQANISVTANFTATQFTLTYTAGANGSITGTVSQTVNQGADGSAVTAVANVGYHFTSWSDGVLTASRTDTNVQANISVTANFVINSYSVTFDPQGGSAVAGQTIAHGGLITQPTTPTRTGYTFVGWFKDTAGTDDWAFATDTVTVATTLYAKWTVTSTGGGGGGGGGFGNQLVGINLSGTSPWMDGNGRALTAGQIRTPDSRLNLTIPVGTAIWNAAGAAQTYLSAAVLAEPPQAPPQHSLVMAWEMGPTGVTFTPAITLTINYADTDIPVGTREADLYIAWWDGTKWVKLEGTINPAANTFTVQVSHFTTFALLIPAAPPSVPTPTLKITTPSVGTSFDSGSVSISITTSNLALVADNRPNAVGEGRVVYYLDVQIPTMPGQTTFSTAGTYKETDSTSNTWANLAPGTHTLGVQLVQNDHTPFSPPIFATVTVTVKNAVIAPPTTSTPPLTQPSLPTTPSSNPTKTNWGIPIFFVVAALSLGIVLYWKSRKPVEKLKYTNR